MDLSINPLDHPDAEVTRAYFCQLSGRSKITAYRHEREDPDWPKPVKRGKRVFYKAIDCKRYLTSAHAQDPVIEFTRPMSPASAFDGGSVKFDAAPTRRFNESECVLASRSLRGSSAHFLVVCPCSRTVDLYAK